MSNRGIFVLSVSCASMIALSVLFIVPLLREPEPKPTCECKAEACPTPEACPPAVECPVQPTLEIHKPLSVELDGVVAACKPAVDRAHVALEDTLADAYQTMANARRLGVSSVSYGWLDNPEARAAGTMLLAAEQVVNRATDAVWDAEHKCREDMEVLFHATDAWVWIDGEEMDEAMSGGRGFAQAFHEFFSDNIWSAKCNAVARRLECPLPKPVEGAVP